MHKLLAGAAALAVVTSFNLTQSQAEDQWGIVKGKVILTDAVPNLKPLVTKGDASTKDAAVCAVENVPDESLVVDPETKGIANVVVWMAKKPTKIHPQLVKSKQPTVVFDQKGCRFIPHVLLVRTDQKVQVISDDGVAHNTHTYPLKNKQENFVVPPNDRVGVTVPSVNVEERLPSKVGCDIHPWMQAWWVILDHPYAAVTNAQGEFEIPDLPEGEHEFRVWQEKAGYLEKSLKVKVKAGENKLNPIKVSASSFK